jgi:hypothetical protein
VAAAPVSQWDDPPLSNAVLSLSEIMTIPIWFHCSGYRNSKTYYQAHVQQHLRPEFPALVSYSRFVKFTPSLVKHLLGQIFADKGYVSQRLF